MKLAQATQALCLRRVSGTPGRQSPACSRGGRDQAPMIQKMGRKNPMMNMIQWPFLSAVNAT